MACDNFFSDPPTVSVTHSPDSAKKMTLNCKVVNKRFACDDVHVKDNHNHNKVDAVPAADVSWWKGGERIESRDEFLLGDTIL